MRTGPVIIGFDGTPSSVRAVQEAAALFASRQALVVLVWEAGRSFQAATLPVRGLEPAPATLDIRTAFEADKAAYDDAQRLAEQGAALARQAGLEADGLAVADDATVADTLARLAREVDAPAVVIGAHHHHALTKLGQASTLSGLLHDAPCPVVACGEAGRGDGSGEARGRHG